MANNLLSSGLEDYIEKIYIAQTKNIQLKAAELARILNVSRASASEALARLVSKNLIEYNSNKNIILTTDGIKIAQEIYNKHSILSNFLNTILSIPLQEAEENACKIEHIISDEIAQKIYNFTKYCKSQEKFLENYRKDCSNNG